MRSSYRNYYIFSEPTANKKGSFDIRVILQKIGTSKISAHYPGCGAETERNAEEHGTDAGEKIVDDIKGRDRKAN